MAGLIAVFVYVLSAKLLASGIKSNYQVIKKPRDMRVRDKTGSHIWRETRPSWPRY